MLKKMKIVLLVMALLPISVFAYAGESREIESIFIDDTLTIESDSMNFWFGETEEGVSFVITDGVYVGSGVTDCGLEFRSYKQSYESMNLEISSLGDSMVIARSATFEGIATPPMRIFWSQNIGGRLWIGTLDLENVNIRTTGDGVSSTHAVYKGTVWSNYKFMNN